MKKLIIALVLCPLFSFAQESGAEKTESHDKYKWEVGVNAGINVSDVRGLANQQTESVTGRMYGLTLIYHFKPAISFKTDLDFEDKGWKVKNYELIQGTDTSVRNVTQNLDYFDIPLFLHFGFGKRLKVDINLGTYVGFLIKDNAFYIDDNNGQTVSVKDALFGGGYKNLDFGLIYGIGFDYVISPRWSFGFDSFVEQGLVAIKDGIKNNAFDFDFGINYTFGKK